MSGYQIEVYGSVKVAAEYFASTADLKDQIVKREKAKPSVHKILVNGNLVWKRK